MVLPTTLTRNDAIRFLQRATFGPRPADVDYLMQIGTDAWFAEQLAKQPAETNYDRWIRLASSYTPSPTIWEGMFGADDQLRKRVAYALSQIIVVSWNSLDASDIVAFADILEAGAFGSFRLLLENVTRSSVMGQYLTYQYNTKADPRSGRLPDENYAREIIQLFAIGLWQLNTNGTRKVDGTGQPIPAYDQNDILGLARVFTGFVPDPAFPNKPELSRRPMVPDLSRYETGAKTFLGFTIPATTGTPTNGDFDNNLKLALDTIVGHPNTAPFICNQLIQRLVTSNPSPAYVQRVVNKWANDGNGQVGNLGAVVKAILTDPDAWDPNASGRFGKLREPVLRFTVASRAMGIQSIGTQASGAWNLGDLENPATELAQQPYDAPTVFNFYKPGYAPPQTFLSDNGLVGPEFQIAGETANIGWLNFLSRRLKSPGTGLSYTATTGVPPANPSSLMAMTDVPTLVDEVGTRLCARALSTDVRNIVISTVTAIKNGNATTQQYERIMGAAVLIAASADFLYER
jgi:uncharacterized protein (DUF1800 family)